MFKPVTPGVNLSDLEEQILEIWKKDKTFEKSLNKKSPKGDWKFLDGPPFVTGMPHYGHLLASIHKDVFGRYYTMKGYHVERIWGWDGHGLPVENKVENKLQIKSKKEIEEKIGVDNFIKECLDYVNHFSNEWDWYIDHIGRWADMENAYKTWDKDYMESVMWVFKKMYENGHIYKGLKVTLYCPHCSTPISNFEVAMDADNYKDMSDHATTYKYELKDERDTYILAWSTTPWNKIVTPALAVNPNLKYIKVRQGNDTYILAETTLKMLDEGGKYEVIDQFKGSKLVGSKFIPHYDYYKNKVKKGTKAFEIIAGDFVTAEEGTGVVTIAAYGEEDLKVMNEQNIHIEMHVDEEGMINKDVPLFGGMYYLKANKEVNKDLMNRGLIYRDEDLMHSVPLCWRCHTRLYYAPIDAWYVDIQKIKDLLKKTNENVNWYPKHFKNGRFLKSLENAPDWNISRNRYWGSPVPVWECDCGERFVPGSIEELEKVSGQKVTDLHKPEIDQVQVKCKKCSRQVKRVPEVLDSWIEAGSASFGERHYPFDGKDELEKFYPPDFIAEYTGQIRAWFYVLHVIGGSLYKSKAFKNVAVEGVILGTDGRKMSKNLGNYPDPRLLLEKYGGDALRLYLMSSPIMNGEDIIISEDQYRQQVKGMILILWNTYNFFVSYANIDNWEPSKDVKESENILDKWILSLLNSLIKDITKDLDDYETVDAISKIGKFIDEFSTWYIRRSRDRVGPVAIDVDDRNAFYATSFEVFVTLSKLIAPIAPFTVEEIYRNLTGEDSVHLADWPSIDEKSINKGLVDQMSDGRVIVENILSLRKKNEIKVKIPVRIVEYKGPRKISDEVLKVVREETNVYEINFQKKSDEYSVGFDSSDINLDLDAGQARDLVRKIQQERKVLKTALDDRVDVSLPEWPAALEKDIKRKALIRNLTKGEFKVTKV